ncbi:MAG: MazG nucleotide pyrophosphohydrolase domain-containing protein [Candidatus Hodarchaeales archaeon]
MKIIEFKEMIKRAQAIRDQYAAFEKKKYGRTWTDEEIALGLVGDIGDLMKLIQAQNKIRDIPDYTEKLKHELADCLWSLIVLANLYEINLEEAFIRTMRELELYLHEK